MADRRHQQGFTLIETVVGLITLALALILLATLLYPQAARSASQVHQARAAQLGQAVLAEVMWRQFDQATPAGGGAVVDADNNADLNCAAVNRDLSEPDNPQKLLLLEDLNWDNDLDGTPGYRIDASALFDTASYDNFQVQLQVSCYQGDSATAAWIDSDASNWSLGAKVIDITVIAPDDSRYAFQMIRGNY